MRKYPMKSYYQMLGVKETATEEEIKKAFRKLARETHPDACPNDATAAERFQEITDAYKILSDPVKRKEYDTERSNQAKTRQSTKTSTFNPFEFMMNSKNMFDDILDEVTSDKQTSTKSKQDPLNVDSMFTNFMGFKPK